jgi:AcrR family transcriptional regulator
VQRDGFAHLTMRGLAADLGVDPMALYHYVPNQAALRQALILHIFATFQPQLDPASPWQAQIWAVVTAYAELTREHPQLLIAIAQDHAAASLAAAQVNPTLHAALRTAGLPTTEIDAVSHTLVDYMHGFMLGAQPAATNAAFVRGIALIVAGALSEAATGMATTIQQTYPHS